MMPLSLVFFFVSMQSGRLVQWIGARALIASGNFLIGIGLLVVAATVAGAPMGLAQAGLVLAGLGMGLNTGPLYGIAVGAVAKERSGTASALVNVARMVGVTLGVALLGSVFAWMHGGADGLRAALLIGGALQLGAAAIAWLMIS